MADNWIITKIYPWARTYQVRTANLETYLTIKGLTGTLHPNLSTPTELFCCNLGICQKLIQYFPLISMLPACWTRHRGFPFQHLKLTEFFKNNKYILFTFFAFNLCSVYSRKKILFSQKEKKCVMAYYVIYLLQFYRGKILNEIQAFCLKAQNLLGKKIYLDTLLNQSLTS